MQPILPKKQMTEEDIKLQYITPAITSKWDISKITMETHITDGKVNLKGIVTNTFELDDVQNAMDSSVNNKADIVKAVVKI